MKSVSLLFGGGKASNTQVLFSSIGIFLLSFVLLLAPQAAAATFSQTVPVTECTRQPAGTIVAYDSSARRSVFPVAGYSRLVSLLNDTTKNRIVICGGVWDITNYSTIDRALIGNVSISGEPVQGRLPVFIGTNSQNAPYFRLTATERAGDIAVQNLIFRIQSDFNQGVFLFENNYPETKIQLKLNTVLLHESNALALAQVNGFWKKMIFSNIMVDGDVENRIVFDTDIGLDDTQIIIRDSDINDTTKTTALLKARERIEPDRYCPCGDRTYTYKIGIQNTRMSGLQKIADLTENRLGLASKLTIHFQDIQLQNMHSVWRDRTYQTQILAGDVEDFTRMGQQVAQFETLRNFHRVMETK